MPEGDTVYLTAQRMHNALVGRVVSRFDLRVPALALADLAGTTVDAVLPVGKHLLVRFSSGQTLHSHLRMDGAWQIRPAAQRSVASASRRPRSAPEHSIRAVIGNTDWLASGVRVHDLALVPTAEEASLIGHLGPDLTQPQPDLTEAIARFAAHPDLAICEALLDQRLAAGIGNVYKSELLFLHKIDPWTPVDQVPVLPAVLADAHRLLRANLRDFNRSTTGWHQAGHQYWVYGRLGKACRRCGGAVAKHEPRDNTGRITYYCPSCQRPG
jgi:endonuclease-8